MFQGQIDNVSGLVVTGWAFNSDRADTRVSLALFVDSEFIRTVTCDAMREDLVRAGIGDGCHSFRVAMPESYRDGIEHRLDIQFPDGTPLRNSPATLLVRPALRLVSTTATSSVQWDQHADLIGLAHDLAALGLIQTEWYLEKWRDVRESGMDPAVHYLTYGDLEGRDPNPYFKTSWYRQAHLAADPKRLALIHYILEGERAGMRPCPVFDPRWYADEYSLSASNENLLGHYLRQRHSHQFSPNRYFSPSFYRRTYEDIALSDIDTFEHWLNWGIFEQRQPSDEFDADFVWKTYLNDDRQQNAFEVFMAVGEARGWLPRRASTTAFTAAEGQVSVSQQQTLARTLLASGLFQASGYREATQQHWLSDIAAALHYLVEGEREGVRPNPFFDPAWYAKKYFARPPAEGPLIHYLQEGERNGLRPCAVFDTTWYAQTYGLDRNTSNVLAHYLAHRSSNHFAPNRYFSPSFYLETYPDVAAAGLDAFEHWFGWGIFEKRRPSLDFNVEFVWQRYLGNNRKLNALQVFMDVGEELGWIPNTESGAQTVHAEIRRNCSKGPLYEPETTPDDRAPNTKVLAYYLPQFHPIEENDAWWGEGFTEWNNIPRGVPRFVGHYQPRIPRDLGFYELNGTSVLKKQVDLARRMGIHGFCFYYYNFNGRRLLERPLDAFKDATDIDFPFTLMWANENWTRRWDGMEKDVLMRQDYRDDDLPSLVADLATYLIHPRYIRVQGRPLLFVYRADVIPNCETFLRKLRAAFRDAHDIDPLIVMAQAFGNDDPTQFGFDGAIEFPPHKVGAGLQELNHELDILDPDFSGSVRSYADAVDFSLSETGHHFPLIRTAFPQWDNDARKQGSGLAFHGSTPQLFEKWLTGLVQYAHEHPFFGEHFVCVNAWNEWCEGAYLEPDTHFGHAYLNALSRVVRQTIRPASNEKVVLVGHDAFRSGAQQLLLHMGRILTQQFGVEVAFILMGDGEMVPAYELVAETYVATRTADVWKGLNDELLRLRKRGFSRALTNSVVSGAAASVLTQSGFQVCSLIHELPTLVKEHSLATQYAAIRDNSHSVVYPNTFVRDAITSEFGMPRNATLIRPQGLYSHLHSATNARADVRRSLGLPDDAHIVLNIGYADFRKGVDAFIATGIAVATELSNVHFVWVGGQHPGLATWLQHDLQRQEHRTVHFVPFSSDVGTYLAAADLFFLSSREDPFPSVVLEALALGLPAAAFDGGSGWNDLLRDERLGFLIPYMDIRTAAKLIASSLLDSSQRTESKRSYRRELVATQYDFADYCGDLLGILYPNRRRISVIVPNYNYARYLDERLSSIFSQSHPIFELIVLDDASSDDSVAVAQSVAETNNRSIRLHTNEKNSGNVFRQWKRGVEMARGELVWIAEADDASDVAFLAELAHALESSPTSLFAFTDSRAIGPSGETMYESYKGYYAEDGDHGLDADASFESLDFIRRFLGSRNCVLNASSILWRKSALQTALNNLGEGAFALSCAGDWRIYVETCLLGGTVHYVANPLNRHRRHSASVTHALQHQKHFDEITSVQSVVRSLFPTDIALASSIQEKQASLAKTWKIGAPTVRTKRR